MRGELTLNPIIEKTYPEESNDPKVERNISPRPYGI
jgi:hypothetical protein